MKWLLFVCFVLCTATFTAVQAQTYLPGLWSGELTQGGETYKFELFIERKKQKLTGRTYIYLPDQTVVTMEFNGLLHKDLSMNIYELKRIEPVEGNDSIYFLRTFQLAYDRQFNSLKMTGYWQERHRSATDKKRRYGRVFLTRRTDKA